MKSIIKKLLTKEVILYIVFGVLTTVVNLGTFFVANTLMKLNENIANIIAIILAVLVAYFTNKDLVFHSEASTFKQKFNEFIKFIVGRAFTMLIEFFGGMILFKIPIPHMISKCFITIVVIVLNFIISKFFTFKKEDNSQKGSEINEEN